MSLKFNHSNESISSDSKILKITNTGAFIVAKGTTAERPITGENGMIRFNTDANDFEGFKGGNWSPLAGGAGTADAIAFAIVFGG